MTGPSLDGIGVDSGGGDEIGDNEGVLSTAFVNGFKVQALWSQQDGAYAIYDGNSQRVTVTNANLVVTGDQFGSNFADTITVDLNAKGGVVVTENGETFSFPFGEIQTVSIFAGGGANTINVLKTSSSSPLSIIGRSDTVNIGSGSVQGRWRCDDPNPRTSTRSTSTPGRHFSAARDARHPGSDGFPIGLTNWPRVDNTSTPTPAASSSGPARRCRQRAGASPLLLVGNGPTTRRRATAPESEILGP
jgi:hypothetical protein